MARAAADTGAKLAWICDPNNPTGLRLGADEWTDFLDASPRPTAWPSSMRPTATTSSLADRIDRVADIRAGRPVIVLRTFSKIFGLAGLRLGYGLAHESLTAHLDAVQEPFNVNCAALAAGLASLRRTDLLPARRRAQVDRARRRLTAPLAAARHPRRMTPTPTSSCWSSATTISASPTRSPATGCWCGPGPSSACPGYVRVTTGEEELMGLGRRADRRARCADEPGRPARSRRAASRRSAPRWPITRRSRSSGRSGFPAEPGIIAVIVPPEIPVGAAELEHLPDLRIAAAPATGFDHLDLEAIAAAGAWATHCPGYCDEEVAEHAIAFALDLLRGVTLLDRSVRGGEWNEFEVEPRRVAGATLGIVGLGRIGRQVAWRGPGSACGSSPTTRMSTPPRPARSSWWTSTELLRRVRRDHAAHHAESRHPRADRPPPSWP